MQKESDLNFTPLPDEAAMAQMAYTRWERAKAETMAEYISRRRTVDLAALAHQVVEDELTPAERTAIRLRYSENLTVGEIAQRLQVHKTTVTHTLQKAEARIRRYLKYVVQYQYDLQHVPFLPLDVRRAMVVSAARYGKADACAYLRNLRKGENLSGTAVADAVGVPVGRLHAIESGQTEPRAQELLRLASFYGVCADSILKGGAPCRRH